MQCRSPKAEGKVSAKKTVTQEPQFFRRTKPDLAGACGRRQLCAEIFYAPEYDILLQISKK